MNESICWEMAKREELNRLRKAVMKLRENPVIRGYFERLDALGPIKYKPQPIQNPHI